MIDIEKSLNSLKKDYLRIEPPLTLLTGWQGPMQRPGFFQAWKRPFALAGLTTLLLVVGLFGLFRLVHAALPGERFYPLKRASENVVSNATGNQQIKVDHRAEEIVKIVSKKRENQEVLELAVKDYKESVAQVKKEAERSEERKTEFEEKSEKQREEFKELIAKDPSLEKDLGDMAVEEEESHQDD